MTGSVAVCPICNARSEIHATELGMMCEACYKEHKAPVKQQTTTYSDDDSFPTHDGDYANIKGRRYELKLVPKQKCKHTIMSWLNNGPQKFPFCPSCGALIERTAINKESISIPKNSEGHVLLQSPRGTTSNERTAGLHGDNPGGDVGNRVEKPKRVKQVKPPTKNTAKRTKESGMSNPSRP